MRECTSGPGERLDPRRLQEAMKVRNISDVAIDPFRGAVVNLQLAIFQKARQGRALIQSLAHRNAVTAQVLRLRVD